jgi:hypothetical protein
MRNLSKGDSRTISQIRSEEMLESSWAVDIVNGGFGVKIDRGE